MESFEPFLRSTEIVDWCHPAVHAKAQELSSGSADLLETARRCFEWVRDKIQHSNDFHRNPVTCSASEALLAGTGYCYAKSHLLAALLRANIPPRRPLEFCSAAAGRRREAPPKPRQRIEARPRFAGCAVRVAQSALGVID